MHNSVSKIWFQWLIFVFSLFYPARDSLSNRLCVFKSSLFIIRANKNARLDLSLKQAHLLFLLYQLSFRAHFIHKYNKQA